MAISGLLTMLKICGALVGVIGACRIYYLWSSGKQEIEREVVMWFGGFMLLMLTIAFHDLLFS